MKLVLTVTTYNRKRVLQNFIKSFVDTRSSLDEWTVIVADDGSDDDTLHYINSQEIGAEVKVITNKRKGIHHQFNTIVKELERTAFDYCFKCDDDIEFIQSGWEELYVSAIRATGYEHLCFFDAGWRPEKNLTPPIEKGPVVSYCEAKDVQGAFFTLTPKVIEKVGYMDVENFGYRGVGHIDYTLRACRAGFNDIEHPFDAKGSEKYIRYQLNNYSSAMPEPLVKAFESDADTKRKYELIKEPRIFIPFKDVIAPLDDATQNLLLIERLKVVENRLKVVENEKKWFEVELKKYRTWSDSEIANMKELYGHLPPWYLKLGKIFKLRKKL